jgi:hypothetical protein
MGRSDFGSILEWEPPEKDEDANMKSLSAKVVNTYGTCHCTLKRLTY